MENHVGVPQKAEDRTPGWSTLSTSVCTSGRTGTGIPSKYLPSLFIAALATRAKMSIVVSFPPLWQTDKMRLRGERVYSDYSSGLQNTTERELRQKLKPASHISSTANSRENWMQTCRLLVRSHVLLSYTVPLPHPHPRPPPREWSHHGLSLSTTINNHDNPPRHAHKPTWSR